jgi:hypothetical protein
MEDVAFSLTLLVAKSFVIQHTLQNLSVHNLIAPDGRSHNLLQFFP